MPVGWSLQQTTLAPGSDKTRGQGSFGPLTGGLDLTYLARTKGRHQSLTEIHYLYSVKIEGGGGPEILSCKDMNSSQNRQITAK